MKLSGDISSNAAQGVYKSDQVSNIPIGPDYNIQGGGPPLGSLDIYTSLAMCKKNSG